MGKFSKLRSWHEVRTFTRVIGGAISKCGRTLHAPYLGAVPDGERRCKRCA